ncbi:MAG: radical SAM protein [Thermoguttaceae bacterium]|jgi:radical SAM protein with 4Fe4S-binding SPASM domain|nr:radical SAM protein [Thermoguttaceae bacterium]
MVTGAAQLARRLAGVLRRDLADFRAALPCRRPRPGLYRYDVHPAGGRRVIHLRIAADGSAVLMIDVGDVVHLNSTAALLTKAALDGVSSGAALAPLLARCAAADRQDIERGAGMIYRMVDHITKCTEACPTCGLAELERTPLFSRPVHAPLKADLALTYGCNNACHHCYNEPGRKRGHMMPTNRWREVLDRLAQIGVPHVIFTGGEPTLFEGLGELVCIASRLGLVAGMNTNGRLLARGTLAAELHRAGLAHVQVTLHSHRPELHNAMTAPSAFDETVAGIERCLAAGLHSITNTTLTRRNAGGIIDMLTFLHARGVRCCALNGMIHSGRGRAHPEAIPAAELAPLLVAVRDRSAELGMRMLWYTPTRYCELSPLELELGARRCNAAEYSMCIEPDGDVLPCQSYYRAAGNLLRDPWPAIWQSPLFRHLRDRVRDPRACGLPEACCDCPDLAVCAGGCPLERERGSI